MAYLVDKSKFARDQPEISSNTGFNYELVWGLNCGDTPPIPCSSINEDFCGYEGFFITTLGPVRCRCLLNFCLSYPTHAHESYLWLFRRSLVVILVALVSRLYDSFIGDGGRLFPLYLWNTWEETSNNNLEWKFSDSNSCTKKTYHMTWGNCSPISIGFFWALIISHSPLEGVSFTCLFLWYLGYF